MHRSFIHSPADAFDLAAHPTRLKLFDDKSRARKSSRRDAKKISTLSHLLYAENSRSLLIVLQGMDTSGKDGTIRTVFARTAPLNLRVEAFKKPTKTELAHDYLWRIHNVCPAKGNITVFNRSHYEDVLIVKVRGFADADQIEARYEQINNFEKHLSDNGTRVLKFMLNISKDTQAKRLQERLTDPRKFWKFNPHDLDDRALWPDFMEAYQTMVERTSTAHAPWHIIPSDSRTTRGAIIANIVRTTLEDMNPQYPASVHTPEDFKIE